MTTAVHSPRSLVAGRVTAHRDLGIEVLLASAVDEVLIMSSGDGNGPIGSLRPVDQRNIRRGVRYRVLCPDSARLSARAAGLALAGAEVRTDAAVPTEAVVIDGRAALLPAACPGPGVAIFRMPSVVAATTGLFDRIWPSAVPLAPAELPTPRGPSALTMRERDLLTLLCAGSTDESAAAKLGISVRTVRRMVADIMSRLGARSRFQAGAKAADRGWLLDTAC